MIENDGQPLSPRDERKEQEKLDRGMAKRASESDSQKRKRKDKRTVAELASDS